MFTGTIAALDTADNSYRVTFDRPGLGTHSIPDYEVWVGNMSVCNKAKLQNECQLIKM